MGILALCTGMIQYRRCIQRLRKVIIETYNCCCHASAYLQTEARMNSSLVLEAPLCIRCTLCYWEYPHLPNCNLSYSLD